MPRCARRSPTIPPRPPGRSGHRPSIPPSCRAVARTLSKAVSALGAIRTPNLLIRSQMLYPLSYERRGRSVGCLSTGRVCQSTAARQRRGRDLNPRTRFSRVNSLAVSPIRPLSHLSQPSSLSRRARGQSPGRRSRKPGASAFGGSCEPTGPAGRRAEREGFEPPSLTTSGFQDRRDRPLRHRSVHDYGLRTWLLSAAIHSVAAFHFASASRRMAAPCSPAAGYDPRNFTVSSSA